MWLAKMERIILLCLVSTYLTAVHAQVNMHGILVGLRFKQAQAHNFCLSFSQKFLFSPKWGPIGYKGNLDLI